MKKFGFLLTVFLLMLVVAACGGKKDEATNVDKNNTTNETENTTGEENGTNTSETKVEIADEAAKLVTDLDEVDSATVLVTDKNAYVAVVLTDKTQTEATTELEDKVAEKVRSSNSAIENVYVSLNPDFVERMTGYGEKLQNGQPVEGFFEEFSDAMKRVFPDAH